MSPHEFQNKWRNNTLKERTASQSHFNDLCALIGVENPISADPRGEWFTFEKGATKTGGGEGWADVWRRGCFAWEYKGNAANLDKAFDQLLRYSIALESPPLLIVCDMHRIRIHTNWTNTVQQVREIDIEDLADAANRDLLRACFLDPESLQPKKTRQMLTEDAAREFAALAQRLRDRGHDSHDVAHFNIRLVFCMFAEDVALLPDKMFQRMLEASRRTPTHFAGHAATLFAAMKAGGMVGFEQVDWFNGGLFDDDTTLPLERDDLDNLLTAAKLDWSEIDPSILGTLFERGLDPDKRSQLGAHYTDREKIMQIVGPVVVEPLQREWAEAKAQIAAAVDAAQTKSGAARNRAQAVAERVMAEWRERLLRFRVLDPACGSGNFLNLSLLALKDLEHRTNLEAEQLGLLLEFPRIGPESVLGIELNPYAAELARVSVWIGEIQWMRRNGFSASRNPILRTLETIENRDAILVEATGERAVWPEADVVVGNPPFLGSSRMIRELGEHYSKSLRKAWPQVPGGADLVCYWFAGAWDRMIASKLNRVGLVSTNSIRGGANREILKPIVEHGQIFEAWDDEEWTVEGAAVRVSMIAFSSKKINSMPRLNGSPVKKIFADLTARVDIIAASNMAENAGICFEGFRKYGDLAVPGSKAREWLRSPKNVNNRPNSDVLYPYVGGRDVVNRNSDVWVIDFHGNSEVQASEYEQPFAHALEVVKPYRMTVRDQQRRENWWLLGRSGGNLRAALAPLTRMIVTPRVSKHRLFVWRKVSIRPSDATNVFARDDDTTFGVLHSRFHEIWALRMGTFLGVGNDPRYTPSTTFETFPFPEGLTPNIPAGDYAADPRAQAIALASARLNELRENWLNPPDLVRGEPEVVPGYPDRILPVNEAAAQELSKRTLTNLYNARPAWLVHAHRALDETVAEAYGWGADFQAGLLTDDEILARLFRLNQTRAKKRRRAKPLASIPQQR